MTEQEKIEYGIRPGMDWRDELRCRLKYIKDQRKKENKDAEDKD